MNKTPASTPSGAWRLFLALWPPGAWAQRTYAVVHRWARQQQARAIAAGSIHLTLAFLGDVAPERLPTLEAAIRALGRTPAEPLVCAHVAHWPGPRVLVIEDSAPTPAWLAYAAALKDTLTALGFVLERRPWRPHLTLARGVRGSLKDLPLVPTLRWGDKAFPVLVRSHLTPQGAKYERLPWTSSALGPGSDGVKADVIGEPLA